MSVQCDNRTHAPRVASGVTTNRADRAVNFWKSLKLFDSLKLSLHALAADRNCPIHPIPEPSHGSKGLKGEERAHLCGVTFASLCRSLCGTRGMHRRFPILKINRHTT
ncbi:hypothetical protein EVAR_30392_1 [Eumeta japonica]|uniref:Uncharacterized protein n=1 Tax=Eumeta variegata TaxID=151549 RepID=A0A4C1W5H8_EUMVA|nr:hypothetical protein EVAR_30392_1 [Eumeta japonica]